jgi:hypothetical protein
MKTVSRPALLVLALTSAALTFGIAACTKKEEAAPATETEAVAPVDAAPADAAPVEPAAEPSAAAPADAAPADAQ